GARTGAARRAGEVIGRRHHQRRPGRRDLELEHGGGKTVGFTAEEVIGRNLIDLLVPPELRERATSGVLGKFNSAARGQPLTMRHGEVPALRKDGSRIQVSVSVSGIYDSAGNLLGASSILRDVTESKRAERELANLASIVNASEDAIISVSKELKITSWNPAA